MLGLERLLKPRSRPARASVDVRRAAATPCERDRHPAIIPRPAPGIAYVEPRYARTATFVGAALPVCGVDVLVVVVQPEILANVHEASLYVVAFQTRFRKVIVLMAQDDAHAPTYFGPAGIVQTISRLPFELIPWRRMSYRAPRRELWMLPVPRDEPVEVTDTMITTEGSTELPTRVLGVRAAAPMTRTTRR